MFFGVGGVVTCGDWNGAGSGGTGFLRVILIQLSAFDFTYPCSPISSLSESSSLLLLNLRVGSQYYYSIRWSKMAQRDFFFNFYRSPRFSLCLLRDSSASSGLARPDRKPLHFLLVFKIRKGEEERRKCIFNFSFIHSFLFVICVYVSCEFVCTCMCKCQRDVRRRCWVPGGCLLQVLVNCLTWAAWI